MEERQKVDTQVQQLKIIHHEPEKVDQKENGKSDEWIKVNMTKWGHPASQESIFFVKKNLIIVYFVPDLTWNKFAFTLSSPPKWLYFPKDNFGDMAVMYLHKKKNF